MNMESINQAIDAAFDAALDEMPNPQRVSAETIAENVTLQTDTYVAPGGSGFRVVCRVSVPEAHFTATRVRNHGPDARSERGWPTEGIEAAAKAHVARCIAAGEAHVRAAGFNADRKVILLNKLLKAKEADALGSLPKLVALYGWMEATQTTAVSGQMGFAAAPHSFEEAVAE